MKQWFRHYSARALLQGWVVFSMPASSLEAWPCLVEHLPVMALLFSAELSLAQYFLVKGGRRQARQAIAVGILAQALFLLVVVLGHAVSLRAWGAPLLLGTLGRQLLGLPALAAHAGVPLGLLVLLFGFFLLFAVHLAWHYAGPPARSLAVKAGPRSASLSLLAALVSLACLLALVHPAYSRFKWEPLTLFFSDAEEYLPATALRLAEALRDEGAMKGLQRGAAQKGRHVIVIVCDGLRADRMSLYGYHRKTTPFLDELSKTGKLKMVGTAIANGPESYTGILGIIAAKSVPRLNMAMPSIGRVLGLHGYELRYFLGGDHQWYGMKKVYGPATQWFDGTLFKGYVSTDDRALLAELKGLPPSPSKPQYLHLHLMMPHAIGIHLPEHQVFGRSRNLQSIRHSAPRTPELAEESGNFYDAAVRQADDEIRQAFATLGEKGWLKDALVLVTGDHGEPMGEHGVWGHKEQVYHESVRVPLIFWDASPWKGALPDFASHVDIGPTILERLGLPWPASWEGDSLLRGRKKAWALSMGVPPRARQAVLYRFEPDSLWTYFRFFGLDGGTEGEALYELRSDPGQRLDRRSEPGSQSVLSEMRKEMDRRTDESNFELQIPDASELQ